MTFEEYYKSLPAEKNDTTMYDLRTAFKLLPEKELEKFQKRRNAHLRSVGYDPSVDTYYFLKRKNHPTIYKELKWYNSNKAKDFRSKYELDTSGDYYKYVPKQQLGGTLNYLDFFK